MVRTGQKNLDIPSQTLHDAYKKCIQKCILDITVAKTWHCSYDSYIFTNSHMIYRNLQKYLFPELNSFFIKESKTKGQQKSAKSFATREASRGTRSSFKGAMTIHRFVNFEKGKIAYPHNKQQIRSRFVMIWMIPMTFQQLSSSNEFLKFQQTFNPFQSCFLWTLWKLWTVCERLPYVSFVFTWQPFCPRSRPGA